LIDYIQSVIEVSLEDEEASAEPLQPKVTVVEDFLKSEM